MAASLLVLFLAALQASFSVLLTLFYGVLAAQFNLISDTSAKDISKACVRMFLPALLIYNVGSQLDFGTATRYIPVLIWAIAYNILTMALGYILTKLFKFPAWFTPAISFNNTTSLPLLLIQALHTTGILSTLDPSSGHGDSVVDRARSYFLINTMVSNCLTFALGPGLLNGNEEDAPDKPEGGEEEKEDNGDDDMENGRVQLSSSANRDQNGDESDSDSSTPNERTSLLPNALADRSEHIIDAAHDAGQKQISKLSPWKQSALSFIYQFINAPLIGAAIGTIIGLNPGLRTLFFNKQQEGGYFNAWFTVSLKNIGDLFAALQVIVVGVKLSKSLRTMKEGEDDSGKLPLAPMVLITFIRFVLWPLISIPFIYYLAVKTSLLNNDPVLWFTMMLMPTGPPAMKLTALADVNGCEEGEKMGIAKVLAFSYTISPLICFTVVGALKASEAAIKK